MVRMFMGIENPSGLIERKQLLEEFSNYYESQNCKSALEIFHNISDLQLPISSETKIKVAHCFYIQRDMTSLKELLSELSWVTNANQKSTLLNQEALMMAFEGDTLSAIKLLKKAIETENSNNFAKHNYEYLRKVYHPNNNQRPQNFDNQTFANEGGQVEKSEKREDDLANMDPPKIDQAQAMQLLDVMRANEFYKLPILGNSKTDTLKYGQW